MINNIESFRRVPAHVVAIDYIRDCVILEDNDNELWEVPCTDGWGIEIEVALLIGDDDYIEGWEIL